MSDITRREFVKVTGSGIALASLSGVLPGLAGCAAGKELQTGYFSRFGIDSETIRKVLSEALVFGGDYTDVFFQHSIRNSIRLEDRIVNSASTRVQLGVGIRVLKGDQTGYSFTEDLNLASMQAAARTAANIASGSKIVPPQEYQPMNLPNYYPVEISWQDVGIDKRVALVKSMDEATFAQDERIIKNYVGLHDTEKYILTANSEGQLSTDYQPMLRLIVYCTAQQGDQRESNYFDYAARDDINFLTPERLERLPREAVKRTVSLFDAQPAPAGELPVVLTAGSSGILLHEAIGHGMEADFNRIGSSIYSDKLNKPIARDFINIVDSGLNLNVRGSINIDDECSDTKETMLVENGVLRTYLHDRISAKHYGVEPTGSGRRESFKYYPMPRMRNTYMLNGPHTFEEIIASVKFGIMADQFTNGQVNIGPGDFTFYVKSGSLIENGKITAPIKDVNIIGNGPEVLERVTMVGNDFAMTEGGWTCGKNGQSLPVSMGLPSALVSSITVGGKG
ncbi:MAG: TldD/PmbA family protein [Candidatus Marinimicrobia bacterium]|nr:TldD/PmbA family protein [Candidatus Neomarinimicrobiota bacterium]